MLIHCLINKVIPNIDESRILTISKDWYNNIRIMSKKYNTHCEIFRIKFTVMMFITKNL